MTQDLIVGWSVVAWVVLGIVLGSFATRFRFRNEKLRNGWPPYEMPGYQRDKFESHCPHCGDAYVYPPVCKPSYCAKLETECSYCHMCYVPSETPHRCTDGGEAMRASFYRGNGRG